MRPVCRSLRLDGIVSRSQYLLSGFSLFFLKYLLDALVVRRFFGRLWLPWDYINIRWREIDWRNHRTAAFSCVMFALALPFIWCGVVLTLKRLRSAALPLVLVWLFFIPYLNLLLFAFLSIAPEKVAAAAIPPGIPFIRSRRKTWSNVFLIVLACVALVAFSVKYLENYGWGLFVGIPFFVGFIPALFNDEGTFLSSFMYSLVIHGCIAVVLLAIAFEGIFCLVMAAPLTLTASAFGVLVGRSLRRIHQFRSEQSMPLFCAGVLIAPIFLLAEKHFTAPPPDLLVTSSVDINAPPEIVWNQVVCFSEIPPPRELIFRSGIAYPIRAEIRGTGRGAIRHCLFSTGPFVEPIDIWQQPELLHFSVISNPPPMRELSPYKIDPPHLHGFLISHAGQFKLTRTATGKTHLEGTTWYVHNLYPESYWRFWSDYIIHKIHLRVLDHIKAEAEGVSQNSFAPGPR